MQKEGAKRKAAGAPLLRVPFTSELGNVTPVFITPAKWMQEEMVKVAQTIVFGTSDNAGCNCLAPKVIVMSAEWSQARPPLVRSIYFQVDKAAIYFQVYLLSGLQKLPGLHAPCRTVHSHLVALSHRHVWRDAGPPERATMQKQHSPCNAQK